MKQFFLRQGLALSLLITIIILPPRLLRDTGSSFALVVSEVSIFILCMLSWLLIQLWIKLPVRYNLLKAMLALVSCILLSVIFFKISEPYITVFPFLEMQGLLKPRKLGMMAYRGFLIGSIFVTAAFYIRQQSNLQKERLEIEKLKQNHLLNQLNMLKQQLSPHFLFNTLNVLKSGSKEAWVKEYVIQLSRVFRYMLSKNTQKSLVLVEEEIDFINGYIHILRERYEDGLEIKINLTEQCLSKYVVPFGIQLLIENAVKHNTISFSKPLTINIYDSGQAIIVSNNKQTTQNTFDDSIGIGLSNLNEQYKLIANKAITVSEQEGLFTVELPLIYEYSDN